MARLVLINGAPGSGKSTVASGLADDRRLALALDVDALKHALGGWDEDAAASGLQARRLALTVAREHLSAGFDVVVGQFAVRADFPEQLAATARALGAAFHEVVLWIDAVSLTHRLAERVARPTRPEHAVNNTLVGPADARRLVEEVDAYLGGRPDAARVDARGTPGETLDLVRALLSRTSS